MFCPKPIRLKPAFFDIFCFFGRIFLEKNAVFCIFCCFASFFLGKNRLFSYAWMSSLFAPYKNAVLFAYCDPPSHPFSSKNLFSAHVPRGSQKAPRNFAEGTRKASRKHSEKFPEGFQKASLEIGKRKKNNNNLLNKLLLILLLLNKIYI